MSILDRFHKKIPPTTHAPLRKSEPEGVESIKERTAPLVGNALSVRVLKRPHVSEKAAHGTEHGTYVFDVAPTAEKIAIKKAVESLYNVKVASVRTIRHAGKPVSRGRRLSARVAWKKAIVTLAPGQKIDVYEGV